MEIENIELPPQEYVEHEGTLYKIDWNPDNSYFESVINSDLYTKGWLLLPPCKLPPTKILEREGVIYWGSNNRVLIFSSDINRRNIKIIPVTKFYELTKTWNIPFNQFAINIPTL